MTVKDPLVKMFVLVAGALLFLAAIHSIHNLMLLKANRIEENKLTTKEANKRLRDINKESRRLKRSISYLEHRIEQGQREAEYWESEIARPAPVPDWLGPSYSDKEVLECAKYLKTITPGLVDGKRTTLCEGNTSYLLVKGTDKDATTIYNRWLMRIKKHKYDLKKDNRNLFVSVLDDKNVEISHHCTAFERH